MSTNVISNKISIQIAGENTLIIYFAKQANAQVSKQVQLASALIRQHMNDEIIDLVPSYASILVMFNMLDNDHHQVRNKLRQVLQKITQESSLSANNAKLVELPVYYAQESGPELNVIAKNANISIEEVISIHQAQEYLVYAIGFAPGFAYLGEVDSRIAAPRLSSPRLQVPKGAVAIADKQTAIYPSASPGGWNIIGLCPIDMFDPKANPIMPVEVGDTVKFKAILKEEFLALGGTFPKSGWEVS